MKITKLQKAYVIFSGAWPTTPRSYKLINESNPVQGSSVFDSFGFSSINSRRVKRMFTFGGGRVYGNNNTAFVPITGPGSDAAAFTITIKNIYGKIIIDNQPLSSLALYRGNQPFYITQFRFIPDFSQSFITYNGGAVGAPGAFVFAFDVALNRAEKNKRENTFQKLNA